MPKKEMNITPQEAKQLVRNLRPWQIFIVNNKTSQGRQHKHTTAQFIYNNKKTTIH